MLGSRSTVRVSFPPVAAIVLASMLAGIRSVATSGSSGDPDAPGPACLRDLAPGLASGIGDELRPLLTDETLHLVDETHTAKGPDRASRWAPHSRPPGGLAPSLEKRPPRSTVA